MSTNLLQMANYDAYKKAIQQAYQANFARYLSGSNISELVDAINTRHTLRPKCTVLELHQYLTGQFTSDGHLLQQSLVDNTIAEHFNKQSHGYSRVTSTLRGDDLSLKSKFEEHLNLRQLLIVDAINFSITTRLGDENTILHIEDKEISILNELTKYFNSQLSPEQVKLRIATVEATKLINQWCNEARDDYLNQQLPANNDTDDDSDDDFEERVAIDTNILKALNQPKLTLNKVGNNSWAKRHPFLTGTMVTAVIACAAAGGTAGGLFGTALFPGLGTAMGIAAGVTLGVVAGLVGGMLACCAIVVGMALYDQGVSRSRKPKITPIPVNQNINTSLVVKNNSTSTILYQTAGNGVPLSDSDVGSSHTSSSPPSPALTVVLVDGDVSKRNDEEVQLLDAHLPVDDSSKDSPLGLG